MMFDTTKIGKKIKTARNEKNMTQMDLADAMGISYQAVSNWERGNSMPDISKLSELCRILDLNLDELFGESESTKTVKKIISDENASITLEELAEVAPIVTPKKVEQVLEENKGTNDSIDMDALIALAPFLDDNYLNEIAEKVSVEHPSQLVGLAPYLEDDTLNRIALRYAETIDEGSLDALIALAPFLEEETLGQLVDKYLSLESCDIKNLTGLSPFLSEATVRKIADRIMKVKDYHALSQIAPFM